MSADPAPVHRRTLRTPADLVSAGLAAPADVPALAAVAGRYAVAVPPALADLIDRSRPDDPIARQVVPSAAELEETAEDRSDPIGDESYSPVAGVVHRYPDRVLLKPLLVCPVYCRFCFRRERVGHADGTLSEAEMDRALAYVAGATAVREVILTGGDPLMLPAGRIAVLTEKLCRLPHVEVVRWHSRLPVAAPERVDAALARALRPPEDSEVGVWVAVHANHPRELSPATRKALRVLAASGLALVSQTVLLKGVNDDPQVLEALFRALVRNGVKPYYLHHPDLARGTAHFRLSLAEGRAIVAALRGRLTGIAQPTYVLDIPGGAGKVPVGPEYWDEDAGIVRDWTGRGHRYPPE
ncbi:MAG: lysine-2,3-aminomutase-like protein [Magnetospirillum sp.]|nr:lysine-2,3-aminomutase-like protein [Magnetospirillum sp.]